MRISKKVYWVLFVYILAFLADGVLTNHFQNYSSSQAIA